jgi:hypothetical protein
MSVSAATTDCKEVDGQLEITSCTANTLLNHIEITLATPILISGSSSEAYRIQVEKAVNLPMTIAVVNGIVLQSQTGEFRSTSFKATVGQLDTINLDPAH